MIKPTIGRVVWFHPIITHNQPWAAIITYVHSDHLVNLVAFEPDGCSYGYTSIPLVQENEENPQGPYCEWMPYQKGQAAKTEEVEAQLKK